MKLTAAKKELTHRYRKSETRKLNVHFTPTRARKHTDTESQPGTQTQRGVSDAKLTAENTSQRQLAVSFHVLAAVHTELL